MDNARFITSDEIDLVRELFSFDSNLVRQDLTDAELDQLLAKWKQWLADGEMKIVILFDENQSPVIMYTGKIVKEIGGWLVGATKVKYSTNNFNKTARRAAPALDLLLSDMESCGYYKFWMMGPEIHHNIRNQVMVKYSKLLSRYDWFDEELIPVGQPSKYSLFDTHRQICNWSDILVRQFALRQEYREKVTKNDI